ncbi:hypothetical protein ACWEN6_00960 [Sphaerisporangium sp. NPDC004334]
MSGYSYTTISMHPGQSPRVGVSIHPDEHARVTYYPAGDSATRSWPSTTATPG